MRNRAFWILVPQAWVESMPSAAAAAAAKSLQLCPTLCDPRDGSPPGSAIPGLQPPRLLRPWGFPSKSTGVGCHCLLRYIYTCITESFCHTLETNTIFNCTSIKIIIILFWLVRMDKGIGVGIPKQNSQFLTRKTILLIFFLSNSSTRLFLTS